MRHQFETLTVFKKSDGDTRHLRESNNSNNAFCQNIVLKSPSWPIILIFNLWQNQHFIIIFETDIDCLHLSRVIKSV